MHAGCVGADLLHLFNRRRPVQLLRPVRVVAGPVPFRRMRLSHGLPPLERFSSFSSGSLILRRFPQPVHVAVLAQKDFLAALGNHGHGWLAHTVKQLQRRGAAIQVKPWERLGDPIFAQGPGNPLHQFLAVGLHQPGLAFCRLVDHHIHRNLSSGFSIIHREDVQNQTIIFTNYSITLCEGASIITSRQRTCLAAFVGMVEECSTWTSKEVAHSLPSGKGPSAYFTSAIRLDALFEAPAPACAVGVSITVEPGAMESVSDEHYQG